MICYHHNDADGRCAGAIVDKYAKENFPDSTVRFQEVDYNIQEDQLVWPLPSETVYIVDFTFTPEIMEKMAKTTSIIYVYDHHKSAKERIDQYPPCVISSYCMNNEFSGCELVWDSLFPNKNMPEAVKLIGDRDAWKWNYGNYTAEFNEGLKLCSHQPADKIWEELLQIPPDIIHPVDWPKFKSVQTIKEKGSTCLKYRDNLTEDFRNQYGFKVEFEGHKCYVMNLMLSGIGTEMFGSKIDEYDICIGMVFDGRTWKFSLRSNGAVDVSEICKKYGEKYNTSGGGHAKAAGFLAPEVPFKI